MRTEVRRFCARADDGTEFVVIEYQNFDTFSPVAGPQQITNTTMDLLLDDERSVNAIDPETFQIVETGQIIRKI